MKMRTSTVEAVGETVRMLVRAAKPLSVVELARSVDVGTDVMRRYVATLEANGLVRAAPTPVVEGRVLRGTHYVWDAQ